MNHAQRLAGVPFFVYRYEHGKLLVSVTSDKLFHIAAAPPCAWGFARSLRKTPLQRFHSIIIGTQGRVSNNPFKAYFAVEGINSEERNVRDRLLSARTDNTKSTRVVYLS